MEPNSPLDMKNDSQQGRAETNGFRFSYFFDRYSQAAFVGYLLLTIAYVGRDLPRLDKEVIAADGATSDGFLHLWNVWWVRHSLLELNTNPFHTDLLWYPNGTTLLFDSFTPLNGLMSIPLVPLLGETLTFNFLLLQSFVWGGWFFYLFLRTWPMHPAVAFLGGILFVLSPFHISHFLYHLNFSSTQFIPLYLMAVRIGTRRGGFGWGALAGFSLLLNVLCEFLYFFFIVPIALAICVERWLQVRRNRAEKSKWFDFLVSGIISSVVFVGPLLGAMLIELYSYEFTPGRDAKFFCADPLMYLVPGPNSAWSAWTQPIWERFPAWPAEHSGGQGLIVFLGIVLALRYRARQTVVWLVLALCFFLYSLGPDLCIYGHRFTTTPRELDSHQMQHSGWLMPYDIILYFVPQLGLMGTPVRFAFPVAICTLIVGCMGLSHWAERFEADKRRAVLMALIVWGTFSFWPRPIWFADFRLSPDETAALERIRNEPGDFGVLQGETDKFITHKWYQTFHHRPLVGGNISRKRQERLAELEQHRLIPVFYGLRELAPRDLPLEESRHDFHKLGIRFVIVTSSPYRKLAQNCGLKLEYDGPRFQVFRVPDQFGAVP